MDFYDRVNIMLKQKNATRKELAEAIGISYNTINGLFKRRSYRIKLELVQKMADFFGTSTDYLAKGKDSSDVGSPYAELERIYKSLPPKQQHEMLTYAYFLLDRLSEQKNGGINK